MAASFPPDILKILAPFEAYYKSITVVDYAGGDSPTNKAVKEYAYREASSSQVTPASTAKNHASEATNAQSHTTFAVPTEGSNISNSTATPIETAAPAPSNTDASTSHVPQSAANRGAVKGSFIAAALFLVYYIA
ncbi:hypothetical protein ACJZ2D_010819 [Fusarium nematophilum]